MSPSKIYKSADYSEIYALDSAKCAKNAESRGNLLLDSALTTQEANSKIVDEFLGLCEASDKDRTLSPSRKRADALPKKSPQDEFVARFCEFMLKSCLWFGIKSFWGFKK